MDAKEMEVIDGGNWAKWIVDFATLYDAITSGWEGMKQGAKDGFADGLASAK